MVRWHRWLLVYKINKRNYMKVLWQGQKDEGWIS